MKKHILTLSINEDHKQFELEDNFKALPLGEMTTVIGFLSALLHNYLHIQGEEQNKYVLKNNN